MGKAIVWASAIAVSISSIAYCTMRYNIEEAKQNAFMMKVCTDAGGKWDMTWGGNWRCTQP